MVDLDPIYVSFASQGHGSEFKVTSRNRIR